MDTSKEYILQCEKAEEIQKLNPFGNGNFISLETSDILHDNVHNTTRGDFVYCRIKNQFHLKFDEIWLPRQDQLQEMVRDNLMPFMLLGKIQAQVNPALNLKLGRDVTISDFEYEKQCDELSNRLFRQQNYYRQFISMEQLWLAFVMKEKHNKVWNGEEWIGG